MRRLAPLLTTVIACGPMYGPSGQAQNQPAQAAATPQQVSGPPGGGDPQFDPARPQARPSDPYTAPQTDPAQDPWAGSRPDPRPTRQPPPQPDPDPDGDDEPPAPPPPSRPQPPPPPPPARGNGLSADTQAILDAHNRYRSQHCAAPLTWSPKLEQVASAWARSLVDQGCKFGHSGGQYGENLAGGTAGTLDGNAVAAMWYDEIKDYSFDRGGFSMNTGHFTQVVWRQTTQIGCGKATCRGMDIWVCNYDPPGNVDGDYRANVKPKGCR